jgi:hypothetical protein
MALRIKRQPDRVGELAQTPSRRASKRPQQLLIEI